MLLLRSSERFKEIAEFDPLTGALDIRAETESDERFSRVSGSYSRLGERLLLLFYKWNGDLYIKTDALPSLLITDDMTARLEDRDEHRTLHFSQADGSTVLSIEYTPTVIDPPLEQDYVSSFVEEEDFDFGMFVRNVLNNPRRRAEIYKNASVLEPA